MPQLELIGLEISRVLSRIITGKLLTEEQIQSISKNTIGSYFTDWLPTPKEEADAKRRVEQARMHISEASGIISGLQDELNQQAQQLDQIIRDIEEKKKQADHYEVLAKTNKEAFDAFKTEMETSLREELIAQAEKGKRLRQAVSFMIWLITLILGAALGAYFIPIINYIRGVPTVS
jgi:flagellar biosynthesis chaperone FliJ